VSHSTGVSETALYYAIVRSSHSQLASFHPDLRNAPVSAQNTHGRWWRINRSSRSDSETLVAISDECFVTSPQMLHVLIVKQISLREGEEARSTKANGGYWSGAA